VKLREVERANDQLQRIDPEFYENVGEWLRELEDAYSKIREPFSREARLLEDEISSIREIVQNIFSTRLKKMVFQAALQAMSAELGTIFLTDGMVETEKKAYDSMVRDIIDFRFRQLTPILRSESLLPKDLSIDEVSERERPDSIQDNRNGGADMMLVRVLRGIPEFLGVDERQWRLGREDVVLLPRTNAQVLVNQGAAAEIKIKR